MKHQMRKSLHIFALTVDVDSALYCMQALPTQPLKYCDSRDESSPRPYYTFPHVHRASHTAPGKILRLDVLQPVYFNLMQRAVHRRLVFRAACRGFLAVVRVD